MYPPAAIEKGISVTRSTGDTTLAIFGLSIAIIVLLLGMGFSCFLHLLRDKIRLKNVTPKSRLEQGIDDPCDLGRQF